MQIKCYEGSQFGWLTLFTKQSWRLRNTPIFQFPLQFRFTCTAEIAGIFVGAEKLEQVFLLFESITRNDA